MCRRTGWLARLLSQYSSFKEDVIDGYGKAANPVRSTSSLLWLQGALITVLPEDLVIRVCQSRTLGMGFSTRYADHYISFAVEVQSEYGFFKKSVKSEQGECFLKIYSKKGLIFFWCSCHSPFFMFFRNIFDILMF